MFLKARLGQAALPAADTTRVSSAHFVCRWADIETTGPYHRVSALLTSAPPLTEFQWQLRRPCRHVDQPCQAGCSTALSIAPEGTSRLTTAPAATTASAPTVIFGSRTAPRADHGAGPNRHLAGYDHTRSQGHELAEAKMTPK